MCTILSTYCIQTQGRFDRKFGESVWLSSEQKLDSTDKPLLTLSFETNFIEAQAAHTKHFGLEIRGLHGDKGKERFGKDTKKFPWLIFFFSTETLYWNSSPRIENDVNHKCYSWATTNSVYDQRELSLVGSKPAFSESCRLFRFLCSSLRQRKAL